MAQIDDACTRLARFTAMLNGEIESNLRNIRATLRGAEGPAAAEMEFEGLLSKLDEVNEAAGDCLDAIRDRAQA